MSEAANWPHRWGGAGYCCAVCGAIKDTDMEEQSCEPPTWWTSTAAAIADGIDADRAYDRLPVLADSLEDAGCDNADVVGFLRAEHPPDVKRFYRRVVEGHASPADIIEAVRWLTEFADDLIQPERSYDEARYQGHKDDPLKWILDGCRERNLYFYGYDTPDELYSSANTDAMWGHYVTLTGDDGPTDDEDEIEPHRYNRVSFSCGC